MKEFLSRKGVAFTERNVSLDEDARKDLLGMGFRATPLTVVGDQKTPGFNPAKLLELLEVTGS